MDSDGLDPEGATPVEAALWAKSDAGGYPHSLIGHLLDTAAVAELLCDRYLSPAACRALDSGVPGRGRSLLVLLSGWHDVGKACPRFQFMELRNAPEGREDEVRAAVRSVGLEDAPSPQVWHHTRAGAFALGEFLRRRGRSDLGWVIPIIEGHHGRFGDRVRGAPSGHGRTPAWNAARDLVFTRVLDEVGIALDDLDGPTPAPEVQAALAGLVSLGDWIASSAHFPGVGLRDVTLEEARGRARAGWGRIGLTPGWDPATLADDASLFEQRFGFPARPLQELVVERARSVQAPGLFVVEAPTGDGKTEAAFAVAEVLAKRFGLGGFVFAMPTQGTTDAMYLRCVEWGRSVDPAFVISLRHGKAMANEAFRASLRDEHVSGVEVDGALVRAGYGVVDEYGLVDVFGAAGSDDGPAVPVGEVAGPAQWLLGRHRALLAPGVVGTVDQVLYAGTRTKYVSLRHAGLLGKVLVIDEVHAYDVYMETFLTTLLRWCSGAGVPVVLMSATLPPEMRQRLVSAYAHGWRGATDATGVSRVGGYPSVMTVPSVSDGVGGPPEVSTTTSWRPDIAVAVEVHESAGPDIASVADLVLGEVAEGGCVLVILNTVARAQGVYRAIRDAEVETVLINGRLTTSERASRTADVVDRLGQRKHRGSGRPERLVIVATQIAEQSFDVDADLLVTDLAPMDLLLQRVGRIHRHDRPEGDRPARMRQPRVVVTGLARTAQGLPEITEAFGFVYEKAALLRSAALVAAADTWSIPSQVPGLVATAYAPDFSGPDSWGDAVIRADREATQRAGERARRAETFTLELGPEATDLVGLHSARIAGEGEDEAIVVRDGEETREVVLVVRESDGRYRTVGSGRALGPNGEVDRDEALARDLLGDTVRIAERDVARLAPPETARRRGRVRLGTLAGWSGEPLLTHLEVVVLGDNLVGVDLPRLSYDRELGLVIERGAR